MYSAVQLNEDEIRQFIKISLCIPIYIQQEATLHSLFYLETALHISGGTHHPSSGAQTTVSTASVICHTVIAICRYRERDGTGLSVFKPVPTLPR